MIKTPRFDAVCQGIGYSHRKRQRLRYRNNHVSAMCRGEKMKSTMTTCWLAVLALSGCTDTDSSVPQPTAIIDLGTLIAEDTPERFWGNRFMSDMGFPEGNSFNVISWDMGRYQVPTRTTQYLTTEVRTWTRRTMWDLAEALIATQSNRSWAH